MNLQGYECWETCLMKSRFKLSCSMCQSIGCYRFVLFFRKVRMYSTDDLDMFVVMIQMYNFGFYYASKWS